MGITRKLPISDQVTRLLHGRITDGLYAPGEKIPSEQDLTEEFGISRGTVRSALANLASKGLIVRKQGDGTYVPENREEGNSFMHAIWEFTRLIEESGRVPSISARQMIVRKANQLEAETLNIKEDTEVLQVERIFLADQTPIIFSRNISPLSFFSVQPDQMDAALGIHEFLEKYSGREIASVDVNIQPILPDEKTRKALLIKDGRPLLRFEEIFRDSFQVPLVYAINIHADKGLNLQGVRPWY